MPTEAAARAIEALVHDYSKLVFHVVYGITGNFEDSQDLTQDVFLHAFRGIDAARAASGPQFQVRPWLLKIAVNTARMYERRQRTLRFFSFTEMQQRQEGIERPSEGVPVYEEIMRTDEMETIVAERDVVGRCLNQLPTALRPVLLLSTVAGFSNQEIADMLALKEPAVRQRLARARKNFRRLYAQACGEHLLPEPMVARSHRQVSWSRGQHARHRPAALVAAVRYHHPHIDQPGHSR